MKSLKAEMFKSLSLAALLIASATFAACSSSDNNIIEEQPVQPTEKVYTMTIQATKATGNDATTRALTLTDKTLNATWKTGETVKVYKVEVDDSDVSYTKVGTLEAQADGVTATLSGTVSDVAVDDHLVLAFLDNDEYDPTKLYYHSQVGTLESIASNFDYAKGEAKVTEVNGSNITVVDWSDNTKSNIAFTNQQAIVKFTLKSGNSPIAIKTLKLHVANNNIVNVTSYEHPASPTKADLTITRATASSEFYVALRTAGDLSNLTLTAIGDVPTDPSVAIDRYTYTKSGSVTFTHGKYYEVTVSMTKLTENVVNLKDVGNLVYNSSLSYTARTGDVLTGKAVKGGDYVDNITINIADGATVTLRDVTIDGSSYSGDSKEKHAGITCEGNATIILEDGTTNTVKGFYSTYPGIYVPEGKTLTIRGNGSLNASSSGGAAGIGGGDKIPCGNIVIEGGTITAAGYGYAAGIGSGNASTCGNISITGGTVTATTDNSSYAAGIGSGNNGTCGNISITGGTVTATGGPLSAGIGGGCYGKCGTITIAKTITIVTATKGNNTATSNNTNPYSIGVGSDNLDYRDGKGSACGTITFDTETFTPTFTPGNAGPDGEPETDDDVNNTWTYSPEPANGTYGGLTLSISGNTWTLTPVP